VRAAAQGGQTNATRAHLVLCAVGDGEAQAIHEDLHGLRRVCTPHNTQRQQEHNTVSRRGADGRTATRTRTGFGPLAELVLAEVHLQLERQVARERIQVGDHLSQPEEQLGPQQGTSKPRRTGMAICFCCADAEGGRPADSAADSDGIRRGLSCHAEHSYI
jgi:hypothetical protein